MTSLARIFHNDDTSFTPLFRLLNDFDNYHQQVEGHSHNQARRGFLWQPKFDLRETSEHYELYGELPGITKENVYVEFPEPQTLLIRGKAETSRSAQSPSTSRTEDVSEPNKIEKSGGVEGSRESVSESPTSKAASDDHPEQFKYWFRERSVGEFSRSFNFPAQLDQDNVSANLKDGILDIIVPKAKKP